MAGIVVDSSIALSWCLPDEDTIDQIQQEVAERGAIAPLHWRLEIASALLMADGGSASLPTSVTQLCRNWKPSRSSLMTRLGREPGRRSCGWRRLIASRHTTPPTSSSRIAEALPLATLDADLQAAARALGIALLAR